MLYENETYAERALLISLDTGAYDTETSLQELIELTESAGAKAVLTLTQKRTAPGGGHLYGKRNGKQAAGRISL